MITVYLLFIYGAGSAYHEQPSKYPTAQACEVVRLALSAKHRWHESICIKAEVIK